MELLSIAIGGVGVVILLLFIFAHTIAHVVLCLSYSGSPMGDAIRFAVKKITCAFNLEGNLRILIDEVDILTARIEEYMKGWQEEWYDQEWLKQMVAIKQEAERLSDEAGHAIKHWYRGWTWSRYSLSERIVTLFFKIDCYLNPEFKGRLARSAVSFIDDKTHIVPLVISDYFNFNKNVAKLHRELLTDTQPQPPLGYSSEEVAQKWIALLEDSKEEGLKLIQEAEDLNKYWFKKWSGSRCSLSKRIAKKITELDKLFAAQWRDLIDIRVEDKRAVNLIS